MFTLTVRDQNIGISENKYFLSNSETYSSKFEDNRNSHVKVDLDNIGQ